MLSVTRLLLLLCLLFSLSAAGQETEKDILYRQGTRYLDGQMRALRKYNTRIQKEQQSLLSKLSRQEARFATKLKNTDSAAYSSYTWQQPSYDSINRMLHPDSMALASRFSRRSNKAIDSLKAVQSFVQSKTNALPINGQLKGTEKLNTYTAPLKVLNSKLNYNDYINSLISQRSNQLKKLSVTNNLASITGMDKQIAFAKSKMHIWKQVADEPSAAEEKALEYLQGTEGFDQVLSKASAGNGISMSNATSAADLEKMGFQTKRQLNTLLKQQFGNNLNAVQQQMSSEVADWQDKATGITKQATGLKQSVTDAKQAVGNIKQQIKPLQLKGNSMKGVPFRKRFEKQYSFQTTRATGDGTPALLQLSAGAGYKQTAKLVLGAGIAANIGMGQSWSSIRFSLEGVGLRTFITYEMFYGISGYAGYERMFKQVSLNANNNELSSVSSPHNTGGYSESVLLGLSKSYKISSKYNGAVQVLWDIWWSEKRLKNPIVLRFVTKIK